ncbi:hypothetical protein JG687_00013680 [Phytophthora cactorum]|uniref:Uncharacterized protein n=1 Tax=Phytophthora cactorum TaxID=29920 RepID=A0A8T1U304_9STRA|nr:hypothetical protein JG687_00013680 [Phytophthora cactorum]
MVHTRSQIYSMLFTDAGNGFYNCTTFGKQYKKGIGYTNLPNHLRCSHEDYEQEAQEAWVICDRLPFAFVERRLTRLNAELSTVSEDTLLRYLILLFEVVESRTEEDLSAQSQYDLIADTSSRYNKPWSAVEFVVGDNCSDYVKKEDELITKVQFLMPKLRTIKGRAIPRRGSHLSPLLRNDIR